MDLGLDPDRRGSTHDHALRLLLLLLHLPSVIRPLPPLLSQSKAKNMRVTVTGKLEPGVTSKVRGGGGGGRKILWLGVYARDSDGHRRRQRPCH